MDPAADWTWVIRPGSEQCWLLDHLASPIFFPVNGIIMYFDDLENTGSSYIDYSNTNMFYYKEKSTLASITNELIRTEWLV